jgi:hypothetical protein
MKKYFPFLLLAVFMTSCTQRSMQRFNRNLQYSERNYSIWQFSGGDTVFHDKFRGIINQEEHSDGIFYFKGDTLIEVSSPYLIKSEK